MKTSGSRPRVLVVEDEPDIQGIIHDIIEEMGVDVVVAGDGLAALEAIEKQHFDLVLLDVMMPRLDGYQTLERMKANPSMARIPVLFVTAKALDAERMRGETLGAVGYITKPFDAEALAERVRVCLSSPKTAE